MFKRDELWHQMHQELLEKVEEEMTLYESGRTDCQNGLEHTPIDASYSYGYRDQYTLDSKLSGRQIEKDEHTNQHVR